MEGLTSGWIKSGLSGNYHYTNRDINKDDIATSPCGFKTRKFSEILKKYEILDPTLICTKCELLLKQWRDNHKKKQQLVSLKPISFVDSHVLKPIICLELGCKKSGAAYVSTTNPEKPHYCIRHNLRVVENIKNLSESIFEIKKKLEVII